ncbi:MAG: hypothetical protein P8N56_01970 [Schleiferiaceae bacterium]|nr:hypothetical protein [Schleiferiaceae bacterium]
MTSQENDEKNDRRRGWVTTLSVHAVLLVLFAFFGLTYQDPPPELGIPINFGYEEDGAGETSAAPAEAVTSPSSSSSDPAEAAMTQDLVDAVAVADKPKDKPKVESTTPTETEQNKAKEPEKPKVSDALNNRLKGGFSQSSTSPGTGSGQGNTTGGGDQGKPTGDAQGNGLGNGGRGNSGDYQLGSRRALERPKPIYDCEGDGVVVVKIWVNRNGVVQRVEGGVSGSTTSQSCLITRAEEAARKTRWEGDPSATDLQVGTIKYRFTRQ